VRFLMAMAISFLIAGCANQQRPQNSQPITCGPGGMGCPQGPMPYGDIPGAVGGSGGPR